MIISRTPLRISFVGGGTDFIEYYRKRNGSVVSATINKHVNVIVSRRIDNRIRAAYSETELVSDVDELKHGIVREAIKMVGINHGIDMTYISDIMVGKEGTGLGASGALTVGILNALYALKGFAVSKERLAEEACIIEIEKLNRPSGKQDQFAAAFGGLNFIEFLPNEGVVVNPIAVSKVKLEELNAKLIIFNTGLATQSTKVLDEQKKNTDINIRRLDAMAELSRRTHQAILDGDFRALGYMLHENWIYKRELASKVTNSFIDACYEKAISAGALGGKILGSGGGGFLLFCVDEDNRPKVVRALSDLSEIKFNFTGKGSRIIFYD